MDCSITEVFIKECARMCESVNSCSECELNRANKPNCAEFMKKSPKKTIEIVQKWSDENPLEIDWSKVPVGTYVQVKSKSSYSWRNAYFALYFPARNYTKFAVLSNSLNGFPTIDNATDITFADCCRLDASVDPTPYLKE